MDEVEEGFRIDKCNQIFCCALYKRDETRSAFNGWGAGRELAEKEQKDLLDAAIAVINRWDTPLWKDVPATAIYINTLRQAVAKFKEQ